MNTSLTYTLIVTGSVAIVLLSLLIRRQLRSQREQKAQRAAEAARLEQEAQAHRRYLIDSVRIISQAVLHDDKMTITEGCIRLKVLLDNLAPHLHQHEHFAVIEQVFDATRHIPFLDGWKALSRREQARFELEMAKIEAEHEPRVRKAMEALQTWPLEQLQ
jgi:hypothetical protein